MEITRDQIEARLAALRSEREQIMASYHANAGAIQDCEHWLAVLNEPEMPEGLGLNDKEASE